MKTDNLAILCSWVNKITYAGRGGGGWVWKDGFLGFLRKVKQNHPHFNTKVD